jgi:diacylglycerol kinase family enzyme
LYARIVQSPEYRNAKRETAAAMLPDLLGPGAEPMDLRFAGPDGTQYETAQIILVSNNAYEIERLEGRGTRKDLDLGVLGVVTARIRDAKEVSRFVALEASGHVRRFEGWLAWETPVFRIDSRDPVEVGLEGEALKMNPPLVFESIPGALRVRLPRTASGRSPAARALHLTSRTTLLELVRIVGGHHVSGTGS